MTQRRPVSKLRLVLNKLLRLVLVLMISVEFAIPMIIMPLYAPRKWCKILRECINQFPNFIFKGHDLV